MLHTLEALTRAIPAALSAGAATGGTTTVAAAATSGSLATAGVLGGVAAILGTAGGLVIQYRKTSVEDVPALRRRLKAAEAQVARTEARADAHEADAQGEVEKLRARVLTLERYLYAAQARLASQGIEVGEP